MCKQLWVNVSSTWELRRWHAGGTYPLPVWDWESGSQCQMPEQYGTEAAPKDRHREGDSQQDRHLLHHRKCHNIGAWRAMPHPPYERSLMCKAWLPRITVTPGDPCSLDCYVPGALVLTQKRWHYSRKKRPVRNQTSTNRGRGVAGGERVI